MIPAVHGVTLLWASRAEHSGSRALRIMCPDLVPDLASLRRSLALRMNVTADQLRKYLEAFISTLQTTADEYLEPSLRDQLLHTSPLPATIVGYVSTSFGVAVEFRPAEKTTVEVHRGSARVEDLLVDAPHKLRNTGPVVWIDGVGTGLYRMTLSGSFPFRLKERDADVTIGEVRFEAGSWSRNVHYAEVYGDRASEHWTVEKAVAQAKDEVLAALAEAKRAEDRKISLQEYTHKFKRKTVLLLGAYDEEGPDRLRHIGDALGELGYEPLVVKDVPDGPYYDLQQKVVALAGISRFVVVDDSTPSGHLSEVEWCKQNNWVTVLLRAGGRGASWTTAGASKLSNVIFETPYDPTFPAPAVQAATAWAEAKIKELQRTFDLTYPWRAAIGEPDLPPTS